MKRTLLNIAILSCITSGIYSADSYSRDLSGAEHTVNQGDAVEDWVLLYGATLNVMPGSRTGAIESLASAGTNMINISGAETKSINLRRDNILMLENSTVNGKIQIFHDAVATSQVTIRNSAIDGASEDGIYLVNQNGPASAGSTISLHAENSVIKGFSGLSLTQSSATISATEVEGTANNRYSGAISIRDGSLTASNQSQLISAGHGVLLGRGESSIVLDNSSLEARGGNAFEVGSLSDQAGSIFNILVQNGSTVSANNGKLLNDAASTYIKTIRFVVDNSHLTGDIAAAAGSDNSVTLRNNASLTGQMTNLTTLTLETGGSWNLVDDANVGEMVMNGGTANLSDSHSTTFRTLTADSLSGSGHFMLATDLAQSLSDKLAIIGNASGDHVLHVRNTGAEPTTDAPLELVRIGSGSAQFSVAGGAVDVGLWKYYLNQNGNSWALEAARQQIIVPVDPGNPEDGGAGGGEEGEGGEEGGTGPITPPVAPPPSGGRELSNSAKTLLGLNAAVDNLWFGENATLAQRMGQMRSAEASSGMWSAIIGRNIRAEAGMDVGYSQSLTGLQIGGDRQVYFNNQPLVLGAFAGYTQSNLHFDGRSSGTFASQYGGAYANWFSESGWYVDALLKADRVTTKARAVMSDGSGAQGKYSQNLFGGQIGGGKKIHVGDRGFFTPFAGFSAMHASGFDAALSNGMKIKAGGRKALQGRIGATTGLNHQLTLGGTLNPYVRVAAVQEFANNNSVNINGTRLDNSVNGTRGEVATGVSWRLSDKVNLRAEVDYGKGQQVERNWGGNAEFEYRF